MLRSTFLGVLSENIAQCQKMFFLCLLFIYTFPIASFHFFSEIIELGSKLGLRGLNSGVGCQNSKIHEI